MKAIPDPTCSSHDSLIGTITAEGYTSTILNDTRDSRVHFIGNADLDADGANGCNGRPAAYKADDSGTELLANGCMYRKNGRVLCRTNDARSIVLLGPDNQPLVLPNGVIPSMTSYFNRKKLRRDPSAYLDSELVPYIVVPPLIIHRTEGAVLGCRCRVTWRGCKPVEGVVGDVGPDEVGEISLAMGRAIGIPEKNMSPRDGGIDAPEVLYELWPGVPALGFEDVAAGWGLMHS
jgi:Fungal chitosanase of glycosyl hydrolase group 75